MGKPGPRSRPPIDKTGRYRKSCSEIADALGFYEDEVWAVFQEAALMFRFEMRVRWSVAEDSAARMVMAIFDKRGCVPS